jgi:hypothetical protein
MKKRKVIMAAMLVLAVFAQHRNGIGQSSDMGSLGNTAYERSGPQSAPGAALQGMSQVINSAGQYNLATSLAAVNITSAQSNELRNQVQAVQAFWAKRNIGAAERQRERGPRPSPEEFARMARAAAPRTLNAGQIDPASGDLNWPPALQYEIFASHRSAIDQCTAKWAKYGALDYTDQERVRAHVNAAFNKLKSQIAFVPPHDYIECRAFLESLLFSTTRSVL